MPRQKAMNDGLLDFRNLPRELRDMVYTEQLQGVFEVYRFTKRGVPPTRSFFTGTSLGAVAPDIRSEYIDCLRKARGSLPSIIIALGEKGLDWIAILAKCQVSAGICLDFDQSGGWRELKEVFEVMRKAQPNLANLKITIAIQDPHSRLCFDEKMEADALRHRADRFRITAKRELVMYDGSNSGFMGYGKTSLPHKSMHVLLSNHFPGYLSVLHGFKKPTAGGLITEKLGWYASGVEEISFDENEALEKALPLPVAGISRVWVVSDVKF